MEKKVIYATVQVAPEATRNASLADIRDSLKHGYPKNTSKWMIRGKNAKVKRLDELMGLEVEEQFQMKMVQPIWGNVLAEEETFPTLEDKKIPLGGTEEDTLAGTLIEDSCDTDNEGIEVGEVQVLTNVGQTEEELLQLRWKQLAASGVPPSVILQRLKLAPHSMLARKTQQRATISMLLEEYSYPLRTKKGIIKAAVQKGIVDALQSGDSKELRAFIELAMKDKELGMTTDDKRVTLSGRAIQSFLDDSGVIDAEFEVIEKGEG